MVEEVDETIVVKMMVDVVGVIHELAGERGERLDSRGVRLMVQAGSEVCGRWVVRFGGSRGSICIRMGRRLRWSCRFFAKYFLAW